MFTDKIDTPGLAEKFARNFFSLKILTSALFLAILLILGNQYIHKFLISFQSISLPFQAFVSPIINFFRNTHLQIKRYASNEIALKKKKMCQDVPRINRVHSKEDNFSRDTRFLRGGKKKRNISRNRQGNERVNVNLRSVVRAGVAQLDGLKAVVFA